MAFSQRIPAILCLAVLLMGGIVTAQDFSPDGEEFLAPAPAPVEPTEFSPEPSEVSPSAEPAEVSPSAEPAEASPSPEPTEASPSPELAEASPSPEPTEASPAPEPTPEPSPSPIEPEVSPTPPSPAPPPLDCPQDENGLTGGFNPIAVDTEDVQILAEASWSDIVAEGATGNVDEACDVSNADLAVITPTAACGQVVAGTVYIIHYTVLLTSCNQITTVKVNVFDPLPVDGDTPELQNFEVFGWVPGPSPSPAIPSPSPALPSPSPAVPSPSPAVPSPSPTPPPNCAHGEPRCRWFVEDAVCCSGSPNATTSKTYAVARLVCSEWMVMPDASCFEVTGPVNSTVFQTYIGWPGIENVYQVDWANTTLNPNTTLPYNGTVTLSIEAARAANPEKCGMPLNQICLYEGQVYSTVVPVPDITVSVVNTPETHYNGLTNSTQLGLLDSLVWSNLEDSTSCLMQTQGAIPPTFYQAGEYLEYNTGFQAECNVTEGATCTVLA